MDNITPKVGDDGVEEIDRNLDGTREVEEVQTWDGTGLKPVRAPCQEDASSAPDNPTTETHHQPSKSKI
jgi:hypothetical protein